MNILISKGRVVDPANLVDASLDLLVENGKIKEVFPGGEGESILRSRGAAQTETIDAAGMVVCPGFIDIHMHEDPVGEDGKLEQDILPAMLRMGVTSVLGGNCGDNRYDPSAYLDLIDREGAAVNVGILAGHQYFREKAGQMDKYAPVSPEQIRVMKEGIREALTQGCTGISFGLRYVPGMTTEEYLEIASLAAEENLLVAAHVRDDAEFVYDAFDEFILAGEKFGVPLQFSHIGSMGAYGQMEKLLTKFDEARARGIDVMADCYPYDAFSTQIGSSTYDPGWLSRYQCGYDAVEICEGPFAGERCSRETFEKTRKEMPEALTVAYVMRPEEVAQAYAHPAVMVGSDGTIHRSKGHPRAAGAFPRFLDQYWKKGSLSLYQCIEKMTAMPARRMGLISKGTLRVGADADLVIFDPETIRDRSTFSAPMEAPEGIMYVLVGGTIACRGGQVTDDRAGKSIRR